MQLNMILLIPENSNPLWKPQGSRVCSLPVKLMEQLDMKKLPVRD